MPPPSKLCRSSTLFERTAIIPTPVLDFLTPALHVERCRGRRDGIIKRDFHVAVRRADSKTFETFFFSALSQVAFSKHTTPRKNTSRRPKTLNPISRFSSLARKQNCGIENDAQQEILYSGRPRKPSSFFQPNFAKTSHLPGAFYEDVDKLQKAFDSRRLVECSGEEMRGHLKEDSTASLEDQLKLLQSVRNLEEKLAKAKAQLHQALERPKQPKKATSPAVFAGQESPQVVLTKDEYLNLVDLYFYSHQSRFAPDSPDQSPTPLFLDDYSFKLSADFSKPTADREDRLEEEEEAVSALKHVEEMLKLNQLREIAVMQAFVELLLDDRSSNAALFQAYKKFPSPGVAYLPSGVIRLFLQQMSTPWVKSEKAMLRYLSLIDDMQKARLPINSAEWSSAIYLAGRSFSRVTEGDVAQSFRLWREMEQEAGVKANHVTFNILFDIAVRAGKYVLGETVLREMHERGLRLNRLGRVSLIHYHGLRGDGDGVRKAYRDFVEAGEIVDTLVLNCVMASLINAQEPVAAEQVYERMKDLQLRLQKGQREDGEEGLFMRYPPPGSDKINMEMASNSLGRILLRAVHLRDLLPEHHAALQSSMPLTPDHTTFRTMISHHASTSGDLDRLTVLMNDMTDLFEIPLNSMGFQLLLKGFALHGASKTAGSKWTPKRLDLVWAACRQAIKDGIKDKKSEPGSPTPTDLTIPTIQEVNAQIPLPREVAKQPPRKLKPWEEFVLDLGHYPRERLIPMHKRKAPLTAEEGEDNPFVSPYFVPTDGEPMAQLTDEEDGEYTLPSPQAQSRGQHEAEREFETPTSVTATRPLIIWLLRAYQRTTNSRTRVEEVWAQVRKLYRPRDQDERDAVIRVLRRALRDCDAAGDGGL